MLRSRNGRADAAQDNENRKKGPPEPGKVVSTAVVASSVAAAIARTLNVRRAICTVAQIVIIVISTVVVGAAEVIRLAASIITIALIAEHHVGAVGSFLEQVGAALHWRIHIHF